MTPNRFFYHNLTTSTQTSRLLATSHLRSFISSRAWIIYNSTFYDCLVQQTELCPCRSIPALWVEVCRRPISILADELTNEASMPGKKLKSTREWTFTVQILLLSTESTIWIALLSERLSRRIVCSFGRSIATVLQALDILLDVFQPWHLDRRFLNRYTQASTPNLPRFMDIFRRLLTTSSSIYFPEPKLGDQYLHKSVNVVPHMIGNVMF